MNLEASRTSSPLRFLPVALSIAIAVLVATTASAQSGPANATSDSNEALARRLDALERTTRAEIDQLKTELEQSRAALADERAQREQLEQRLAAAAPATTPPGAAAVAPTSPNAVAQNPPPRPDRTKLGTGGEATTENPDPLRDIAFGREIAGNVYTGDNFKVRLGASLRTSFQFNTTPVGDSVSQALLPSPVIPGGGDNAGRDSFRALAGFSRVSIAIQGPPTLGGQTYGYLELDFARNLSGGESGAVNPNPRVRHAYMRWSFADVGKTGSFLNLTIGQTGGYLDLLPDTVDFATFTGGLGVAYRRNPRIGVVYGLPVGSAGRLVFGGGIERPILGGDNVDTDLGNGDVSQVPVVSAGVGYETTRRVGFGDSFGMANLRFGVRVMRGRFVERFAKGTLDPDFNLQTDYDERTFSGGAVTGGFAIDRLGFNTEGRSHTLSIRGGGLWTSGDARFIDAGFDRRLVLRSDGSLESAHSAGGFVNPIFFLSENVSLRWAGGAQYALDPNLPVITASLNNGYFRTRNWQSEASIWWTPGPFSFAIGYNFTHTNFRTIDPVTFATGDLANSNAKIEAISWFTF